MSVDAEMPKYRCHKEVWALQILEIEQHKGGDATFRPADTSYAPIYLTPEYMQKHQPKPGGYYVVYADGYLSYSPAKAFEEGYTKIS